MTIGPEAWANRSLAIVRLAVPASAPPLRAVSRKLRRGAFLCFILFAPSEKDCLTVSTVRGSGERSRAPPSALVRYPHKQRCPFPSETRADRVSARSPHFAR